MKNLKLYTTFLLAGFLFPVLFFAQMPNEYLLEEAEHFPLYPTEFQLINNNETAIDFRDDDDLLIARRYDEWEDNAWVGTSTPE